MICFFLMSPKGAAIWKPGAKPRDTEIVTRQALKGRNNPCLTSSYRALTGLGVLFRRCSRGVAPGCRIMPFQGTVFFCRLCSMTGGCKKPAREPGRITRRLRKSAKLELRTLKRPDILQILTLTTAKACLPAGQRCNASAEQDWYVGEVVPCRIPPAERQSPFPARAGRLRRRCGPDAAGRYRRDATRLFERFGRRVAAPAWKERSVEQPDTGAQKSLGEGPSY